MDVGTSESFEVNIKVSLWVDAQTHSPWEQECRCDTESHHDTDDDEEREVSGDAGDDEHSWDVELTDGQTRR